MVEEQNENLICQSSNLLDVESRIKMLDRRQYLIKSIRKYIVLQMKLSIILEFCTIYLVFIKN